ncbi:MAG: hypothetical protein Q8N98_02755 [bacterium]|nr:hypothetical protein [bacterium]
MILRFSKLFFEQKKKLSPVIRKKLLKQLLLLQGNYHHPSLRTKRMANSDVFEARVDRHYRFTYIINGEYGLVLTVGPHDEGLGKR